MTLAHASALIAGITMAPPTHPRRHPPLIWRQPPNGTPADHARLAADPAFWDGIEKDEGNRKGSATWEGEIAAIVAEMREERERRARDAAALRRIEEERERLAEEGGGRVASDPATRASAYLSSISTGPNDAFWATMCAVRGFALGAEAGAALVIREYAPRYHRKLPPREVRDMARRAEKHGRLEWGWLLTADRRR